MRNYNVLKTINFRKIIYLIVLFSVTDLSAQEEFFGNRNGVSTGYLHSFHNDFNSINGYALSAYLKKGFAFGAGLNSIEDKVFPLASISYFVKSDLDNAPLIAAMGLSYSKIEKLKVPGFNFALIKCFFYESSLPFSLKSSFSIQAGISDLEKVEILPTVGFGYTQAFFAKERLYPLVGASITYQFINEIYLPSIYFGLNFKLTN